MHFNAGASSKAMSTLHFSYGGTAPASSDLAVIAGGFETAFSSHLASLMAANNELKQVVLQDLGSSSPGVGISSTPVVGTRSGPDIPAGSAVLIGFEIKRKFRGGKPRVYLPFGVANDIVGAGGWDSTFVNSVTSSWSAFITAVLALTSGPTSLTAQVNVSYYRGYSSPVTLPSGRVKQHAAINPAGPIVDAILGFGVASQVGSQRRRNRAS